MLKPLFCSFLLAAAAFLPANAQEWAFFLDKSVEPEPALQWGSRHNYHFSEGLAFVKHKDADAFGFIDKTGKWAIDPVFKSDRQYRHGISNSNFSEGLASVLVYDWVGCKTENKGMGCIDKTGKWVIKPVFKYISQFSEGLAAASMPNGLAGFIDKTGKWVVEPQFASLGKLCDGLAMAQAVSYGPYGFVDRTGKWIIEPQFYSVGCFSEGLAPAVVKQYGDWGYLDKIGKWAIKPKFHEALDFSEGRALVRTEGKVNKSEVGYAYIDKSGKIAWGDVELHYHYFRILKQGLIPEPGDGHFGFIDANGKWVIKPTFRTVGNFHEGLAYAEEEGTGRIGFIRHPTNPNPDPKPNPKPNPDPIGEKTPVIQWESPQSGEITTKNSTFNVSACVQSPTEVKNVQLYLNGKLQTTKGFIVEEDCKYQLATTINLNKGRNEVYIMASNSAGSGKSASCFINYQTDQPNPKPNPVSAGNYHALLIGVNEYQNMGDLRNPIADMEKMQDILTNIYTFEPNDVRLLKNPSKQQIVTEISNLQNRLGEKDHLIIFFSGHGTEYNKEGYWLPADAESSKGGSKWLAYSEILTYIRKFKAKHILLMGDACYSGSMVLGDNMMQERTCEILDKLTSRRIITAGAKTVVPDESVFLNYFSKALRDNRETCISAEDVYLSIKQSVIYNSPNNHIPQSGILPNTGAEGGEFIFRKK